MVAWPVIELRSVHSEISAPVQGLYKAVSLLMDQPLVKGIREEVTRRDPPPCDEQAALKEINY